MKKELTQKGQLWLITTSQQKERYGVPLAKRRLCVPVPACARRQRWLCRFVQVCGTPLDHRGSDFLSRGWSASKVRDCYLGRSGSRGNVYEKGWQIQGSGSNPTCRLAAVGGRPGRQREPVGQGSRSEAGVEASGRATMG